MESNNQYKQITIPVKGMSCASCAMTVENTLKQSKGVKSCTVNIGNEKAKIEFDPEYTSLEILDSQIKPFGYSLEIENISNTDSDIQNSAAKEKQYEIKQQKDKLSFILPLTFLIFFAMLWEIGAKTLSWVPEFPIPMEIFEVIGLILATISLFWVGSEFLKEIWVFLKYRVANMYTLIGIGTLVAYLYSTFIVLFPEITQLLGIPHAVYFDVTIVVIGFVYLGKYLETRSKLATGEAIQKLINLQAKTAWIERDGKEIEIKIEEVKTGDIVIIKPAGKIPVDGIIISGHSSIDESMITGESIPIDKTKGDNVIGGTLNKQGAFKFKATKVGSETMLAQIIKLVDEAQGSKAPIQNLADKISAIFVPVVLVISFTTFIIWLTLGTYYIGFADSLAFGLLCFTGILVIACPCALGLATPTAIIVGTGKGAENGILIKDAASLQKLASVNTIVTDKTGTITNGKPEVTDITIIDSNMSETETMILLASLEKSSEHPLGMAIIDKAKKLNLKLETVDNFKIIEGIGLSATIDGQDYYAGNLKLVRNLNLKIDNSLIEDFARQGKTPVIFMTKNKILAVIGISDTVKTKAKETITALHKLGIRVIMLSGDNRHTAKYIASQVGIDDVIAEVLPDEKSNAIKQLQAKGDIVAMVGDGVNDAPALAQADIGIAMATGTDVAIESASITLLKGDFTKVLHSIQLAKATMNAIKQNLFWAFAYNILGIPLAAGLFYPFFGIILNPIFAGLAMALSSVCVVSNSLRLKLGKF